MNFSDHTFIVGEITFREKIKLFSWLPWQEICLPEPLLVKSYDPQLQLVLFVNFNLVNEHRNMK